jgi:hypothetical protein
MVKSILSLSGRLDKMTLPRQQKMRLIRALEILIGLWHPTALLILRHTVRRDEKAA